MSTRTITIHADELEYTPQGLRTRTPLSLEPGFHHRIVVRQPNKVAAVPVGLGGFGRDSSFPTPVSLALLISPSLRALFDADAAPIYQIYGHASRDGNDAHNKALSDRRANVMKALLVGDVDGFVDVAKEESWGAAEQQVMLRVLHCDPGIIDGSLGPLSEVAVADFQEDYRDGIFHRHGESEPRDSALVVDGTLGPKTAEALLDAFVNACSPRVDLGQIHPTHPTVGCSEFNGLPIEDADSTRNRRASLVIHESLPEFHDAAPCTQGDHSVCPLDDDEPQRCPWYRAHVDDTADTRPHLHTDLRWMPLSEGRVLLSALTTLADGDSVEFEVHRSQPLSGPDDISESILGDSVSPTLSGSVTMGVAQVVWTPDDDFDPFNSDEWYTAFTVDELAANPALPFERDGNLRPPLFRVKGGETTAISEPPGQQLHRIRFTHEDGQPADEGKTAWGVDSYGHVIQVGVAGRRPHTDGRAIDESVRVMKIEPIHYAPVPPRDE